jgi:UDP-arabinose 4-epimerase
LPRSLDESNLNPTLYYQNNVGGTAALLEATRECGVGKMVFSSSCAVYGTPAVVPIAEESPYAPINPYGATKMICERMLRECAVAFPLSFMALRYFNAAGADPDCEIGECHVPETHVIPLLLDRRPDKGRASRFSATIIPPPTALVSVTTST